MTTEPRPRTYRLTKEQIEAMIETAAEKGAAKGTKEILRHFGVFDEKGAHVLTIQWQKISGLMDVYDKAALSMGRGILWLLGAGLAILDPIVMPQPVFLTDDQTVISKEELEKLRAAAAKK